MAKSILVLMVEDLDIAQVAAHNLFKKFDCQLHIVTHATRALQQMLTTSYDIVFIDIQLPDINGFELAKTIRLTERGWRRLPLIAVTADSNESLAAKTKAAGFDDYAVKPLTVEVIRHIFSKHLNKSQLALMNPDAA